MTKLVLISGKDMCEILERLGFQRIHQKGSHIRYIHADGRKTTVPVHGNELLGRGMIKKILKQIRLTREEYESLR